MADAVLETVNNGTPAPEGTTAENNTAPAPEVLISSHDDEPTRKAIEAAQKRETRGYDDDEADFGDPSEETGEGAKKERPANIPEKFWNAETGTVDYEALANSYNELERKQGQPKTPEAKEPTEGAPADKTEGKAGEGEGGEKTPDPDTVTEIVNTQEYNDEFNSTNDLSEATRSKIAKTLAKVAGSAERAREMVDGYVEGLQARSERAVDAIKTEIAGSVKEYSDMAKWALENLEAKEIEAFNADVKSGNLRQAKLAVQSLFGRFKAGVEEIPNMVGGRGGPSRGGGEVYQSQDEITADIENPRYDKDESFRRMVDAKIDRSVGAR